MRYKLIAETEDGEVIAKIESNDLRIVDGEMYKIATAVDKYRLKKMEDKYPDSFTSEKDEETGVTPH